MVTERIEVLRCRSVMLPETSGAGCASALVGGTRSVADAGELILIVTFPAERSPVPRTGGNSPGDHNATPLSGTAGYQHSERREQTLLPLPPLAIESSGTARRNRSPRGVAVV